MSPMIATAAFVPAVSRTPGVGAVSVLLAHRETCDLAPPVVWVTAPVPMTVEEAAALLYGVLAPREACTADASVARWVVADLVVNGGCAAVAGFDWTVTSARAEGTLDAAHWAVCLRLAYLATVGGSAEQTPITVHPGDPRPASSRVPMSAS
ncbi:MAG: hypothetical protein ACR2GH_09885 [Pseudonocardia sp.]